MTSSNDIGGEIPPPFVTGTAPMYPLAGGSGRRDPDALLPRFLWCEILTVCGFLVILSSTALQIFVIAKMQGLVATYGWGHVPRELVPDTTAIALVSQILFWVGFVLFFSAFFTGMARARRVAAESLGNVFEYGYGWTVAAMFIPIVALYRPWVGLAEIRSAIIGGARRSGWSSAAGGGSGSGATWTIAAIVIISGPVNLALAASIDGQPGPGAAAYAVWIHSALINLGARMAAHAVMHGAMVVYLITLHRPLRRAALSGAGIARA